jgi:hypothetical protein
MKSHSVPTVIVGILIFIGSATAAGWAFPPEQPGPASPRLFPA